MIDFLVFSRNRPLQLHALISSMKKYASGEYTVSVLHRYDNDFAKSLEEIMLEFPNVTFVEQNDFKQDVVQWLEKSKDQCSFLVDDIIFKDYVDFNVVSSVMSNNPILCFSLRLGLHLTRCYTLDKDQPVPDGSVHSGMFIWGWKNSQFDWNYPFSVDGHIFRSAEMKDWASMIDYRNPNQFEDALQLIARSMKIYDHCACFVRSKIFNIPMNRVQDEYLNRHGDIGSDQTLKIWESGKRIDYIKFFNTSNDGAHSIVDLALK